LCVRLPQLRTSCCEPSYNIGLALMRGEVERRTTELVQQYEACAVCPQYLKGAHMAIARGEVDGGSLVLVSHINPRPGSQQCLYTTNATHQSLIQHWRAPPLVRLLDVAAGGDQQWHDLGGISVRGRRVKRRLLIVVGDVRVCLVRQQQPNDLDVACVRRDDKRGDAVLIALIEVGARCDEIADILNATASCGFDQRLGGLLREGGSMYRPQHPQRERRAPQPHALAEMHKAHPIPHDGQHAPPYCDDSRQSRRAVGLVLSLRPEGSFGPIVVGRG